MSIVRKRRNNKRGAIELQFNWIFVLVAGFIIFTFIISIILSQKKSADAALGVDITNQITAELQGKRAPNTFYEVTIPESTFTFRCTKDDGYFDMKISESTPLPTDIIFTDKTLQTKKLYLWTREFRLPYTITTVTYLTQPSTAFILYNATGNTAYTVNELRYLDEIYADLSSTNITLLVANGNDIASKAGQFKRSHIICFDGNCPKTIANTNVYDITPNQTLNSLDAYGTIKINGGDETAYITKTTLYGAIFSENKNYYECQLNRLMGQFEIKRELMQTRIALLDEGYKKINNDCRFRLTGPEQSIIDMNISTSSSWYNNDTITNSNMKRAYDNTLQVNNGNEDLKIHSCTLLY